MNHSWNNLKYKLPLNFTKLYSELIKGNIYAKICAFIHNSLVYNIDHMRYLANNLPNILKYSQVRMIKYFTLFK